VALPVSVVSAGIVSGDLILGLSDGKLINAGRAQGPAGLRGPDGPPGPRGKDGVDGNTVHHSAGRPAPSLGVDGDHHVNTVDWEWSIKESGKWGKGQPLLASRSNAKGAVTHSDRLAAGGGRFFPVGGVSASVSAATKSGGGLDPIIGNKLPLAKDTTTVIASDASGELIKVILYLRNATHTYSTEVVALRAGTTGAWTSAWEIGVPVTGQPNVDFTASVVSGALQLSITSDADWDEIRGVVILV